jgi:7-cyano-7-deazaguanine synthase in queuosine biosynthesis
MLRDTKGSATHETQRVGAVNKAIVLTSGGLDSATVLAVAHAAGKDCFSLTIDYGQRHRSELAAAERVAAQYTDVEHRVVTLDLSFLSGSCPHRCLGRGANNPLDGYSGDLCAG